MENSEREEIIQRVRSFSSQARTAARTADQGSLDCAADLEALYQDMSWADEVEPPKNKVWRGRPVDPCSRNRFAGWVLTKTGLSPGRVRQLSLAHELVPIIATAVAVIPEGERSLRPLRGLIGNGYGDSIPQVYKRAVELAGGLPPTSEHTTRAKREFLAKFTRTQVARATQEQKVAEYRKKIMSTFIALKYFDENAARGLLDDLSSL